MRTGRATQHMTSFRRRNILSNGLKEVAWQRAGRSIREKVVR